MSIVHNNNDQFKTPTLFFQPPKKPLPDKVSPTFINGPFCPLFKHVLPVLIKNILHVFTGRCTIKPMVDGYLVRSGLVGCRSKT